MDRRREAWIGRERHGEERRLNRTERRSGIIGVDRTGETTTEDR